MFLFDCVYDYQTQNTSLNEEQGSTKVKYKIINLINA
jgi:hypothetical protein